jgi:hypothetical protein
MRIKKRRIYLAVVVLLAVLYSYLIGIPTYEKVIPRQTTENSPKIEDITPNKVQEEKATPIEKKVVPVPQSTESVKIERGPVVPLVSKDSVSLEEQSYSISNQRKEIPITPGVSLQPGKSINIKVPGREELLRLQRDKTYHPGGYTVLFEKKY